jgi:hypothetical protein
MVSPKKSGTNPVTVASGKKFARLPISRVIVPMIFAVSSITQTISLMKKP